MAPLSAPVRAPRRAAPRRDERAGEAPLSVVTRREHAARVARRRARITYALAGGVLAGALLAVTVGQAFVATEQVHVDSVEQQLSGALTRNQDLQLERAQLEAPARILQIAEHDLGMVMPAHVVYLPPVSPGPPATSTGRR